MIDINNIKQGDTILVKCKVEAVFSMSQMVMVTTRDCDQGFDAYTDEIVCIGENVSSVPTMGKWIYNKKEDSYKCSLCGFPCHKDSLGAIPTKYCAEWGAKMEA